MTKAHVKIKPISKSQDNQAARSLCAPTPTRHKSSSIKNVQITSASANNADNHKVIGEILRQQRFQKRNKAGAPLSSDPSADDRLWVST